MHRERYKRLPRFILLNKKGREGGAVPVHPSRSREKKKGKDKLQKKKTASWLPNSPSKRKKKKKEKGINIKTPSQA